MKKITILLLGMFTIISLQAQNYYIDFTASGAASTLNSIFVENLSQGTSLTLGGSDTLHLIGTGDIIDKNQNKEDIKIYPNPFNEKSYLEFYNETQTMISIDIYDVVGKNVFSLRQEMERGMHLFEMTGFATGHYQLIVKADTWQKTAAFVTLQTSGTQTPQVQFKSTLSKETPTNTVIKNSSKNTFQMSYVTGDQMRFIGFSGQLSKILNDIPTSSKTIDFVFTSFVCGDNVTFTYNGQNVTYGTVVSTGGTCWLDRNLGATQVATSSTNAAAYGDLFQWGRVADGHQIRTSNTTPTLSNSDTPGHANFILAPNSPYDWSSSQNANLWQGVGGVNNPCPTGWRLPTDAEWDAEHSSWSQNNSAGAFASPLKLPVAGNRSFIDGSLFDVGSRGRYWSSTVGGADSRALYFGSSNANMSSSRRAYGFSVRCLKDN